MDKQPTMSRSELEAAILELYRQLHRLQKQAMVLSAALNAACQSTIVAENKPAETGPKDEFMETFERLTAPQKKAVALIVAMNAACNEEGHR